MEPAALELATRLATWKQKECRKARICALGSRLDSLEPSPSSTKAMKQFNLPTFASAFKLP
jgi:hypothetical protein